MTRVTQMSSLFELCVIVLYISRSSADVVLNQKSSETARVGASIQLECEVSGYNINDHHMHWVRQATGAKSFVWLAAFRTGQTTYIADSFRGRVTPSTSGSTARLKIDGLSESDTAKYYCTRLYNWFEHWGKGTTVVVTTAETSSPSLFPLISCDHSKDPITVGCLAKNFLPDTLTFSWSDKSNNSIKDFRSFPSVLQSGSSTFTASTQVSVSTDGWEKTRPFYCAAKHGDKNKSLMIDSTGNQLSSPIVSLHPPIKEDAVNVENLTILCLMKGFAPNNIEVKWLKNGEETTTDTTTEESVKDSAGHFDKVSYITVTKKDWDTDTVYSCVVRHKASDFEDTKNVSKSTVCEQQSCSTQIEVSTIPPSYESIFETKNAKLTCLVTNLGTPEGISITWVNSKGENLKTTLENPTYENNGYSMVGIATVCADEWATGKFTCKVKHPELASLKEVSLTKENGEPLRSPTVLLYPPQQDEIAKGEAVTLTCLIKNFYPSPVFVKWLQGDKEVPKEQYKNTNLIKEGRSYSFFSMLTIQKIEEWTTGETFSCVVGHESLPLQLTQKSVDKSSGKPTLMNVSLVMSDTC